ncbi:filamentous haemagglutinin family protein [Pelagerythrobacter marensis]|nr:filamentous haemagglutinin family protein [Pelagerythrobacter marensis]
MTGASLAAMASFAIAPAKAQDVPQDVVFGDMIALTGGNVQLPDGSYSRWEGANNPVIGTDADGNPLMTIEQTKQRALLDWERFSLKTGEILEFQQQAADWIAVNRVHGEQASQIDGTIRAQGRVFILNDNGVLFGEGANIDVRQLVTGKGVSDVLIDGNVTTIVQKDERAILNWSDMSSQAGEVLRFQQEQSDWLALNRSLLEGTTRLAGNIEADGHVYLVAPGGLSIAGSIDAQQVILSQLDISDAQFEAGLDERICVSRCNSGSRSPTFSNSWAPGYADFVSGKIDVDEYFRVIGDAASSGGADVYDENDESRYSLIVESTGQITTGALGKAILLGTRVDNRGIVSVTDEGQVILAAGENIWLDRDPTQDGRFGAFAGYWDIYQAGSIQFASGLRTVNEANRAFWKEVTGNDYELGYRFGNFEWSQVVPLADELLILKALDRIDSQNIYVRNSGIVSAERGGYIDFRGMRIDQFGAVQMTSTANFRGTISLDARSYALDEDVTNDTLGRPLPNNGVVTFGKNSLTQITPDLESDDTIPLTEGAQNVGTLTINAFRVDMQDDSMIYLPSGTVNVWLDDENKFNGSNRGPQGSSNNETGTRFLMRQGATIDLSGWETTVGMGYHQVSGKIFAAQLADSPVQRDGVFYRKEVTVDRRYGTDLINWEGFDNLSAGTLDQFLINGGTFTLDTDNDFIMMSGSLIDISGGSITYEAGTVTTTLVRTLDGRLIDIREANPDELYMGLANEFTQYDVKWAEQQTYIVPFVSPTVTRHEESYVEGGNAGLIEIIAPDVVLQGTVLGDVTIGKYQRENMPDLGQFVIGTGGKDESEYNSNYIRVDGYENVLGADFGIGNNLNFAFARQKGLELGLQGEELEVFVEGYTSGNLAEAYARFEGEALGLEGDELDTFIADYAAANPSEDYARTFGEAEGLTGEALDAFVAEFVAAHRPFGVEYDESLFAAGDGVPSDQVLRDNLLLTSDDFFNRSIMGSFDITGRSQQPPSSELPEGVARHGVVIGEDVALDLSYGGSLSLAMLDGQIDFAGSIRTGGGDVALSGRDLVFGDAAVIDTSAGWINEYEGASGEFGPRPLADAIRINGGDVTLFAGQGSDSADAGSMVLPASVTLNMSGGAWARRDGTIRGGTGGDLFIGGLDAKELAGDALYDAVAFGLGGNGKLTLQLGGTVYIGEEAGEFPVDPDGEDTPMLAPGEDGADPAPGPELPDYLLLSPELFGNSGFSAINVQSDRLMVTEGTTVDARAATYRLIPPAPDRSIAPWQLADTGSDLSDLLEVVELPLGMRPKAVRRGMDVTLNGGSIAVVADGASVRTEAGGQIAINAHDIEIHGLLQADGGAIGLGGSNAGGSIHIGSNAELRARGVAVVTDIVSSRDGSEWRDGYVLDGGEISLSAASLTIDEGAVLDVRGAEAVFDILPEDGSSLTRVPTLIGSDGGSIALLAGKLDIAGATYLAQGGGTRGRGGSFSLQFEATFGAAEGDGPSTVDIAQNLLFPNGGVYEFYDENFNLLRDLTGVDLSTIAYLFRYTDFGFFDIAVEPGLSFDSVDELSGFIASQSLGSLGSPPALIVGDPDVAFEYVGGGDGAAGFPAGFGDLIGYLGYVELPAYDGPPRETRLPIDAIVNGGFSSLTLGSNAPLMFAGDVTIGASTPLQSLKFTAPLIAALEGANVSLSAEVVNFNEPTSSLGLDLLTSALALTNAATDGSGATFTTHSGTITDIETAAFLGFDAVNLFSDGDVRLRGYPLDQLIDGERAPSSMSVSGDLNIKADQLYAASGRDFTLRAGGTLEILPQDSGQPINDTPYEAAATLTLEAPRIVQGGTVRSPLGAIILSAIDDGSEGAGTVTLLDGSITSVASDGNIVPYGRLNNGDTWLNPLYFGNDGLDAAELRILPERRVTIEGQVVDLQEGALVDLHGGGDLLASEFTPGTGGTHDWLSGYFDNDYDWISDNSGIYAIVPDYQGDVAPVGLGDGGPLVGQKIYLSGGGGLEAGHYTLMPAEYALLPGAFRVTANHQYGGDYTDVQLGAGRPLNDGSSLQAGYMYQGEISNRDQRTSAFLVMPRETLFARSTYNIQTASGFFGSKEFLEKALRENREVPDAPRTPLDGGSIVLAATESMYLNASVDSAAAEGGRGGLADIVAPRIAVVGADTDTSAYDGYLLLDSEQLSSLGAESLLLGGTREQGDVNLELSVTATEVVIDNAGSVLDGSELLFAAQGDIALMSGSAIETTGTISGDASNLRVVSAHGRLVDTKGTSTSNDDVVVHEALDFGSVLRLSSNDQIDILRDADAVSAYSELSEAELTAVNDYRAALGLAAIGTGGVIAIHDGASIASSASLTLDATDNVLIDEAATVRAPQVSASASRVSIGAVPDGVGGLVFGENSLGALAQAEDILLKSYSEIDFYGDVAIDAAGALTFDARAIRAVDPSGGTVSIAAETLTLANSNAGRSDIATGDARLRLDADNLYLSGNDKWLIGFDQVEMNVAEYVVGGDENTLYVPGALDISAGAVTAESGSRQFFDASGNISIAANGAELDEFVTFGATLGFTGASVSNEGTLALTGGTVQMRAREGDVVLSGGVIDVTSDQLEIFDKLVGVGAGNVSLVSDVGDVRIAESAAIDLSGTEAGGDAGTLTLSAAQGVVALAGTVRADAAEGFRSGSLAMTVRTLDDFAGLNAALDNGGFRQSRAFQVNQGDVALDGNVSVQQFTVVANDGSIDVSGTIETPGERGGRIQLSASDTVRLASTARLLARAGAEDGAGGTVLLETRGRNGGMIEIASGALIDVSGEGEGGRTVRLRAPQVGGDDVAIGAIDGTITGARQVVAEAYRSYDDVETIDQAVIDLVSADADAFMVFADTINARLGGGVEVAPGIELRNSGDMELVTDWDLSGLRWDDVAGVLTLRAEGDLLINGNLSDGFAGTDADAALLGGPSWTFNLVGGANIESPNSLGVLPLGQLAADAGSVVIGGTPDTVEYYIRPEDGRTRLFLRDPNTGRFLRDESDGYYYQSFTELEWDEGAGTYLDPITGEPIPYDAEAGYADADNYAARPLPWAWFNIGGAYGIFVPNQDMTEVNRISGNPLTLTDYFQWDNATGNIVRTGTGAINVASGRNFVLQEWPSVLYTAGEEADPVADFDPVLTGYTPTNGGDINITAAGDIIGGASPQLPSGWLRKWGSVTPEGLFATASDRPYNQLTWVVDFGRYRAGVGALGGGNVSVEAGGNINELSVNIPTTGRVAGGRTEGEETVFHQTGGGNLTVRAGGNIRGGQYYAGDGIGEVTAGGAFLASPDAVARIYNETNSGIRDAISYDCGRSTCVDIHSDPSVFTTYFDLNPVFYTSGGQLSLQSGGDMNVEAVLDPLAYGMYENREAVMLSYTEDASVSIFSAGGDIRIWNNSQNLRTPRNLGNHIQHTQYDEVIDFSGTFSALRLTELDMTLWPGTVQATAAAGDIAVYGGLLMAPAKQGNLELIARDNVQIGNFSTLTTPNSNSPIFVERNLQSSRSGIYMSQAFLELLPTPENPLTSMGGELTEAVLRHAGMSGTYNDEYSIWFSREVLPDLHAGDLEPARIYAGLGEIVTTETVNLPKQLEMRAGSHVYFPRITVQHNNPTDLTLIDAGGGIYFTTNSFVRVAGEGRLDFEAGGDFWIPSNEHGITTDDVLLEMGRNTPAEYWRPETDAADISITVGLDQEADYSGFAEWLFNPEGAETPDYALIDAGNGKMLSMYLFDRLNGRADRDGDIELISEDLEAGFVNYIRGLQGLEPLESEAEQARYLYDAWDYWLALPAGQDTPFDGFFPRGKEAANVEPTFYLPEAQQGLVNYVRQMHGMEELATQEDQLAFLDEAWAMWEAMPIDDQKPFYRTVLGLELRSTGRDANDADSPRYETTFRGYDAIARLFPGAEKREDEALAEGESRWDGSFQTYASRVLSQGGGDISFVIPGGRLDLANVAATNEQTGQPSSPVDQGDALRAGLITQNGGAINVFAHDDVLVNSSRVLTAKGGNIMIWSSYGDIAAGAGAKTSISPANFNYEYNEWFDLGREAAGLPTGAGIGTLASTDGAPAADVDLIAPNGIIDAGDAGIRVSGNFSVFAVQILGTDNIDVSGIATGLPVPPAAPPTSLDTGDVASQANRAIDAITDAMAQAQENAAVQAPSIIEVRVTGYGEEECAEDRRNCRPAGSGTGAAATLPEAPGTVLTQVAAKAAPSARVAFSLPAQSLRTMLTEIGRSAGVNILYDNGVLKNRRVAGLSGSMTVEEALNRLLTGDRVEAIRLDARTIILVPQRSGQPQSQSLTARL